MAIEPISLIQTVGVVVAGASLTLNYFSHRTSVIDTPFERESKIDQKIERIPIAIGEFSKDNYEIVVEYIKSTIDEEQMGWYSYRFISPFGEMRGQTQISFSIRNADSDLESKKYVSDLSDMETQISKIGVNVEADTGGMLHVTVDTVEVSEVGNSIADITALDYSLEQDSEVFEKEFE